MVAAAVVVGGDTEERIAGLVEANVDIVVVDTAHGHTKGVLDRIAWTKKHFPRRTGDRRQCHHRRRRVGSGQSRCRWR